MRIGLAQINSILGDFQSNAQKILDFTQQASLNKVCQLVVFPEVALFVYNPLVKHSSQGCKALRKKGVARKR